MVSTLVVLSKKKSGRTSNDLFTMLDYSRLNHAHVLCSFPLHVVVCDPPCENGSCVSNDTCSCSTGFEGERCTDAGNRGKELSNGN